MWGVYDVCSVQKVALKNKTSMEAVVHCVSLSLI